MSFRNRKPTAFDRQLVYVDNLLAARRSVVGHVRISRPLVSGQQWSMFFRFGSAAGDDDTTVALSLDRGPRCRLSNAKFIFQFFRCLE